LYLDAGVPEYWVVNPNARTISRWQHAGDPGEILSQRVVWHPSGMDSALTIDLPAFFTEALGDA